jgi:hypothetical protein
LVFHHPAQPLVILMKPVSVIFILQPKHDYEAAGHSKSKPENINERKSFVIQKISPGCFEVILNHNFFLLFG